jgi:cleavage and polyadenylation specificity factor subunit 1
MLDEETGAEPRIISADIVDPYLLLMRDDTSVYIAHIDKNNELEEVEKEDEALVTTKWVSGCLYHDQAGIFGKGNKAGEDILMFLLSASGALYVCIKRLPLGEGPVLTVCSRSIGYQISQSRSTLLKVYPTSLPI